jgi:hypothetical protein
LRVRVYSVFVGLLAGYWVAILVQENMYRAGFYVALLVIASTLMELVVGDLWTRSRFPASTQTLLSRLEINFERVNQHIPAYVQQLIDTLTNCDVQRVSGTVHLRVPLNTLSEDREEALVQLTGYAGAGRGGAWRFTAATKGIIGRCLRTGAQQIVNFASEAEYLERMVLEFGFSQRETATHTRDARSYLAYPIRTRSGLIGVLYLFSTEVQVFPRAVNETRLEGTAATIAAFLEGAVNLSELPLA